MKVNRLWLLVLLWLAPASALAQGIGPDFTALSAAAVRATVHIQVERGPLIAAGIQQLARERLIPVPRPQASGLQTSSGSGVIFDKSGLVLTNHHVINGATTLRVSMHDKRVFKAEVVGSDPRTDLAVLAIKGPGPFEAANFALDAPVQVGEWVVAVGHPFNFPFTVTAGIVSALGRRGLARNEIQDYIQTDVAVNPGSSGGPLFDTTGAVVGINTAIFSPDKENTASAGISFAIPAAMAHRVASKLAAGEPIATAGIGLRIDDAQATATESRQGARVTQVIAGGPAEQAGVRRGDIIYAVDGVRVGGRADFTGVLQAKDVGVLVSLDLARGPVSKIIEVRTQDASKIGAQLGVEKEKTKQWAGLSMMDATPERLLARGISAPNRDGGSVLVTAVEPGSPASVAGLLPGDVLLQIQESPIKSVDELLKTVDNRRVVLVSFWRGESRYLAALANRVDPG